ncbi:MAG: hypothetical protein ACI8PZ_007037, partial [Myxococcota bacterium]
MHRFALTLLLAAIGTPTALACAPAEINGVVGCDDVVVGKLHPGDWPSAMPDLHWVFGLLTQVECPYGFDSFQLGSELGADCIYENAPGIRCLSETCSPEGYHAPAGPGYWEQSGPEDIWQFSCPSDGTVHIDFTDLDCDLDFMILESDCDTIGGVVAGSVLDFRVSDSVEFECVAGEVYYIVVEGFGFSYHGFEGYAKPAPGWNPGYCFSEFPDLDYGDYTMTISDCPGEPLVEDCFNGVDDDDDGLADCDDPDCVCPELCDNGIDDDDDLLIDCNDPDCVDTPTCCDDDDDGFVDADCGGTDCPDDVFDCCDAEGDLIPDRCDVCPDDADPLQTDGDGDGYGDVCDLCEGFDDDLDTDRDGVPNGCELCPGFDDMLDTDGDGVPNGCDLCPEGDDALDGDGDGV